MLVSWWKWFAVFLVLYAIIGGLLMEVPRLDILNESIRNTYYHVAQWFAMLLLCTASLVFSIRYLSTGQHRFDVLAHETAFVALLTGIIGITTGMVWAQFTWGAFWVNDVKLNGTAVSLLIYLAYFLLRSSLKEDGIRARTAAVYNIFAFAMLMLFVMVLPRLTDSLHPGNGGNPAFGSYDMDNKMRMVFYPAILGWTLLGVWFIDLRIRLRKIEDTINEND
ncbi:MAG: cytochrome c biogenesis protein CcsA [Flavobacteriales bacterium]|nr:cytochrome c biogenesis protein CcsA [Flavobacteriales bacterium]